MTFDAFCRGRKEEIGVGPGAYNIPSTFGQGPRYSFKSRPKDYGPQYAPKYYNLPSTLSKTAVNLGEKNPKSMRRVPKEEFTPGYNTIPSTIGEGPKVAILNIYKTKTYVTPGPGQYEAKILDKGPSVTVGVGKRFDFMQESNSVPPGAYNIPSTIQVRTSHEPKKKILPRKGKYSKTQIPGPIYNVDRPLGSDARKSAFSRAPRDIPIQKTPGPGDYEINRDMLDRSKLGTSMHIRPKEQSQDITNAPYVNLPTTIIPRKKSMASRPATSYDTPSPGPIYNIPPTIVPKKKSIGVRLESKITNADIPGPDAYFQSDAPRDLSQDVICPLNIPYERDIINFKEAKSLPGPADYTPVVFDAEKERAFTIQSREAFRPKPDTNAPYRVLSSTLGGPAYTIGVKDY